MASSTLFPGELVINDSTPDSIIDTSGNLAKGLELGRRSTPYGRMANTTTFPKNLIIPRSEWQSRIEEKEKLKNRHSDIVLKQGLNCKDQSSTNYCWINAPVYCFEAKRVIQGQKLIYFSPASVGAKVKQFRNVGGWGEEGIIEMAAGGVTPVQYWPANAIEKVYNTEANKLIASQYKVTEWWELIPKNLDELITCLLMNEPVAVGYNWWGHEVSGCDAVWIDGEVALRIRNSWGMGWGSKGFSVLQGKRMLPDDAVVPTVVSAA